MTTTKKPANSHEATAIHATNEGDETMKTTTKSHLTNATNATNEGETTMKTTQTSHSETTLTATAPTAAAITPAVLAATPVATTSPSSAMLAYIQTCTTLMDQLDAAFPQADSLTAKDKRHLAKARKGSERFTPQVVALARQHGVNLALVPLDTIANASVEAAALVPLQKRFEALSARAASRTFELQSTSWSGSTKLYTVLKRLSRDSGDIQTGLAPVEHFFNQRHPLVAREHPKTKKGKAALASEKAAEAAEAPNAVGTGAGATPARDPLAPPPSAGNGASHP
jgi:hypothetical protein